MYELSFAHLDAADHERDVVADLRRRQILKAAGRKTASPTVQALPLSSPRHSGAPARTTAR